MGAISASVALLGISGAEGYGTRGEAPVFDAVSDNFQLVGHNPLGMRGMNAALAVHGDYAYVGSRTDGKPWGTQLNVNNAGIQIVNISNPAAPTVVGQIGPPNEGLTDQTSREMRVWPQQDLLIVQNLSSNCSELIHNCAPAGGTPDVFSFYDIAGAKGAAPVKVLDFDPPANPHEFFLWVDPFNPDRALFFVGPGGTRRMQVYDISPVAQGQQPFLLGDVATGIPAGNLHSLGVSTDGMTGYYAHLVGGVAVADTSDFANGAASPTARLITPAAKRVSWAGPGAHSAVKIPGQDYMFVSDEVYGEVLREPAFSPSHGCPWGWTRFVDISDPTTPVVRAEYKLPQNNESFCETDVPRPFTSISAHNPTLTPHIAFITWHSGGFQAIDITDPAAPVKAGEYIPDPLPAVAQEDPVLSTGADKVVMWSYPVIKDGLIYVVDLRNGLYILRYTGPHAEEVAAVDFLEGNSNLGDALKFEPPDPCLRTPPPPGTVCP
ncbi:MAG: LVIVD repeat-containing protein [Actinomycetota bacterium]